MNDNVNHPSHYNVEGKKECIDEMIDLFGIENTIIFALLNAYKYMYRDGLKSLSLDDREKAKWYLDWADNKIKVYRLQNTVCAQYYYNLVSKYKSTYLN